MVATLASGNALTGWRVEKHFPNTAQCILITRPAHIHILGNQRTTNLAFQNSADLAAEQRRLDALGYFTSRKAEAGG
jgi:hypothetical protein